MNRKDWKNKAKNTIKNNLGSLLPFVLFVNLIVVIKMFISGINTFKLARSIFDVNLFWSIRAMSSFAKQVFFRKSFLMSVILLFINSIINLGKNAYMESVNFNDTNINNYNTLLSPLEDMNSFISSVGSFFLAKIMIIIAYIVNFLIAGILIGLITTISGFSSILIIGILFIIITIPAFLFKYSYSMIAFLKNKKPELSIIEAMKASRRIMKEYRWDLVFLDISFVGWRILEGLIIPMIYTVPYYQFTKYNFFEEIYYSPNSQSKLDYL